MDGLSRRSNICRMRSSNSLAPVAVLLLSGVLLGLSVEYADAQTAAGSITTMAGSGTSGGFSGDGALATAARLYSPTGVAVDGAGNVYVADTYNHRIRKVAAATGVITTIAGSGTYGGFSGDGGMATAAQLNSPSGVAVDGAGDVYVADTDNHRIRKVTAATGIITTIAGSGTYGFGGDGGVATAAQMYYPSGVAVDGAGNVYVADTNNNRIRKVTAATGIMSTVAGSGTYGFSGDGAAAPAAQMRSPEGVAVDGAGNVYIADSYNYRVRRVSAATGNITTVAGTGGSGYSGEAGAATAAQLYYPSGVAVDETGNVYIADRYNDRIRKVTAATGIITTIAGSGTHGFGGDSGVATAAQLDYPSGMAVDAAGTVYVADTSNHRIRKVAVLRKVGSDFNGDGRADFLWRHSTRGEVWLWPMVGTTPAGESYVGTVADTGWEIRGLGDQTGDGKADILWRHKATGMIYFWPMDGKTRLGEIYVATIDPAYDIVGTGDYNGDGKSDILWRHLTNGELWVWLMNGATVVSSTYVTTVDPRYDVVGSGDLDGDTKADIVWRNKTYGDVWVWLMNGATPTAMTYVTTVADLGYQVVGVADYTGDERADILWHHATRGEVWLWPMDGNSLVSQWYVGTVPDTAYRIVGTGDYNGDGKADILWHHATRGEVWVWLMDGMTKLSEAMVATVPDVGYQIIKMR
jgi:ribosomal protein S11